MAQTQPAAGTVYRNAAGEPMLYLRTEKDEHLFLLSRDRVPFTHRTKEVPPEHELIIDTQGRAQANEHEWLRMAAEHEIEILLGLLSKACGWLPRERANELRAEYLETRP